MIEGSRDILGIDIGMSAIKFAWVHKSGVSSQVKAVLSKTMARSDSGNFVDNNREFVADIIKTSVKEIEFPSKRAFLCLSGPNLYIRRISVVSMPHEELKEAVKWAIKDQIPIDSDRVIIDYKILGEVKDIKGTNHINILVAVADKNFIFDCVKIVFQAELYLEGISFFPFVVGNIQPKNQLMAVIDIGASKAEFTLLNEGLPQFSRVLSGSGNEFTKAMTGALVSDKGKLELSYDEAEKLKIKVGIPDEDSGVIKQEISNLQFISMFRPVIERLENELKRSLEYCKSQLKLYAPKKIFLTGGGSLLKNLETMFSKDMGIEFTFLKDEKSVFFDAAVAVALDEGISLNMIPPEVKEERARKLQNVYLRMVIMISFSVLFVSYLFMNLKIHNLRKEISLANANYNAIQEVLVLKDKIDDRISVLENIGSGRYASSIVLKALSKAVPPSVELDVFTRNANGDINIKGTVASGRPEAILAEFTGNMQTTQVFRKIKIVSMQKDPSHPGASNFNMYCEVSPRGK